MCYFMFLFLLLQLLNTVCLVYFFFLKSYFEAFRLLTLYIFIKGCILLLNGGDLWAGFLWIVDFNLLFIFLLYGLYLTNLQITNLNNLLPAPVSIENKFKYMCIFILMILVFWIFSLNKTYIPVVCNAEAVEIQCVDYYTIFTHQIISNLELIYLLYFKLNVLEFILINSILFLAILIVIYLYYNITQMYIFKILKLKKQNTLNLFFFKQQNFNKQKNSYNAIVNVFVNVAKMYIYIHFR